MSTERENFRHEVRAWLDTNAPRKGSPEDFSAIHVVSARTREEFEARERHALDTTREWQRRLHAAGYAGRAWPEEYGGQGRPRWEAEVLTEEQSRYGVSTKMLSIALEMIPPVLFEYGTHEQRLKHLPRIVRGDEAWCQLLSEPDAGSDLTNVQCYAAPVEDGWSVTGQKVWTSGAVGADYAILLARTDRDVPGRGGVSCFALDMNQDGVDVRPLRQMSGGYHFNEVFLAKAHIPRDGLIGELGQGFPILRVMLTSERSAIGGGTSARSATQLRALARALGRDAEPVVRQELARAHTREWLLDAVQARADQVPAAASVVKLLYSEHGRLSGNTAMELLGAAATAQSPPERTHGDGQIDNHSDAVTDGDLAEPWIDRFLFAPGLRLGGGTDEIQRTTIAERGLGLPREPAPPSS